MKWLTLLTIVFFAGLLQPGYTQNETRVGGYGELHYNKPTDGLSEAASAGKLDFHRFVLYFSHPFEDWIWFYSELEIEHTRLEGARTAASWPWNRLISRCSTARHSGSVPAL